MKNGVTIKELLEKYNLLQCNVKDLNKAISSLRKEKDAWKDETGDNDIEKDERPVVKMLYEHYNNALLELEEFESTRWKEVLV